MKLLTFVIPVAPYHKHFVQEAVNSVRMQTVQCEVIVIDDKDGKGPGWARNKGLRQVTTPYVCFLDADDQLLPRYAEMCLSAWQPFRYVWTAWYREGKVCPYPGLEAAHLVTSVMATDLARSIGGFHEATEAEDTDFYANLMQIGVRGLHINEPLMHYSTRGLRGQLLHDSGRTDRVLSEIRARRHVPITIPETAEGFDALCDSVFPQPRFTGDQLDADALRYVRPERVDISLFAPTANRLRYLQNMVRSARLFMPVDCTYEIIIVDGGSTDGTLEWCRQQPDIVLIEHGELKGTVKAFTDGGKASRGTYAVMCNDDTEFMPGALAAAKAWLDARSTCGCVAFAYDMPSHPGQFVVGKHTFQKPNGQISEQNFANMGMYRTALGNAVGWCGADDPDFGARSYGSDSYLSVRVWEAGYTIDEVDGATVRDWDVHDTLKAVNQWPPDMNNPDTQKFYQRYPHGPHVPLIPKPIHDV